MHDFLEQLYYADLQLKNAINSPFLVDQPDEMVHQTKHLLISAQFMIKLAQHQAKDIF